MLNGAGECTGFLTAREWGLAETPVFLTSTMQLGRVYDAACELMLGTVRRHLRGRRDPDRRRVRRLLPLGRTPHAGVPRRRRLGVGRGRRIGGLARSGLPRARSARAPAWRASASRAGSVRRPASCRPATPSASSCCATSASVPGSRSLAFRSVSCCRPTPIPRAGARGLLPRCRRHGCALAAVGVRAPRSPDRPGSGPRRLDGPPWERRDLRRAVATGCAPTDRVRCPGQSRFAGEGWTRSSWPPSMPPRRPY